MLNNQEIERLKQGIVATIASPVIGGIEDYSWEAIFHYVKNIPLLDPALGRTKQLFDAVDVNNKAGWSLKSLQLSNLRVGNSFSYVIQRADIIKKANELGFSSLSIDSPPTELGNALIKHWNEKIESSKRSQGVAYSYEGILLKNKQGNEYFYCEFPLEPYNPHDFSWQWTTNKNTGGTGAGLQGRIDNQLELVWYKNQKQLFRSRIISSKAVYFKVNRVRLTPDQYVETILSTLQTKLNTKTNDLTLEE